VVLRQCMQRKHRVSCQKEAPCSLEMMAGGEKNCDHITKLLLFMVRGGGRGGVRGHLIRVSQHTLTIPSDEYPLAAADVCD
jgi:hypothetical protein